MALRMSEEEYAAFLARQRKGERIAAPASGLLAMTEEPKRPKYGNHRVEVNGMKFDSKHEAEVFLQLDARRRAGELKCVLRQVPFDLPGGIRYMADFVAIGADMSVEGVYDAKSEITKKNRTYINKRKQVLAIYGIEIREV